MQYVGQKFGRPSLFSIAVGQVGPGQRILPEGFDLVAPVMSLTVHLSTHQLSRVILFGFGSKGAQCALLRTIRLQPHQTAPEGPWEELFWFNAEPNMALDRFQRAIDQGVCLAVREVQQDVSRSQP